MRVLLLLLSLFLSAAVMGQGTTTSSMKGKVTGPDGESLIGANVVATHIPSNTTFGTVTDLDGQFQLPGLRVGGPYQIVVSYTGYNASTLDNVQLRLGEAFNYNFTLDEATVELSAVMVTAASGVTGQNAGTSTQITSDIIDNIPTLNRDLDDYLRLTPQSAGYSGGTTFGGINNRYNAIYIDGAVNNDVFGLASSGTNGGQTGISPFSIDIIDQVQVALSPYDVSLGGFGGAAINAVTKSGTNEMQGTAYYFLQNEGLVGKTNQQIIDFTSADDSPTKVADFTKKTFGASLGGPIMKNKMFFFVNAEIQQDAVPAPFNFGTYGGNYIQNDSITILRNYLTDTYGFNAGRIDAIEDELDGLKLFGKIDWNLSDKHRLTIRHNYTKAEQFDLTPHSATQINFSSAGIYFPSTTNSTAIELNSRFGAKASNNLILGYTTVRDDRDPNGADFPYVIIEDGGSNTIRFGSDEFSTGNKLDTDIFTVTDNFKIYSGAHTFTLGTHNEFYSIYNLFLGQNYGTYRYSSIGAFMNPNQTAKEYDRAYSLVDNVTGDGSAAAAEFNAMQIGLYAQDEWIVNNQLSLTAGVRVDMPVITSDPAIHPDFNTTVLPALQAQYAIANEVEGGKAPDGQLMISPRLGFTYDIDRAKGLRIRGGAGVFTSRIPFVWPGAMFNTNGLVQGRVDETNAGEPIFFRPDVNNQYRNNNFATPSGDVNLFVKDFKYPQFFRASLGLDFNLFAGIQGTLEGTYTKTMNNVLYTNINNDLNDPVTWEGTPDARVIYKRRTIVGGGYGSIYVGSNTKEGNAYTVTASLSKQFESNLNASLALSYGDANALNEGTSSQNSSQWRGQMTHALGRNNPVYGRSDFALGHRIMAVLSQDINWGGNKNFTTTLSLFYDGMTGSPYSYVIGGNNGRNINNDLGSTSANRALVWIPASQSEINLVDATIGGVMVTAAEQWEQLNAFIENDPYLSKHRGQYAEKNANWMPFTSFVDFSLRQNVGITSGETTHRLQFSFDVFNVLNLISSDWGIRYSVPGDFNNFFLYDLVSAPGATTPQFTYRYGDRVGKDAFNFSDFSSRYQMRLGVRYIFN